MNAAELGVYFALVLGVVLLPGVDMAFVLGWSLARGWRGGAAALAGVVAGALCHLTMGALGLALLIKAVPGAFTTMMLVGAAYLAWLGWGLMRAQPQASQASQAPLEVHPLPSDSAEAASGAPHGAIPARQDAGGRSSAAVFGGAVLTNLMNPKAYLFSLAVLPQFLHPERGSWGWQLGAIGAVTALTQIGVYGGLAVMATAGHQRLRGMSAGQQRLLMRMVGLLLWAMAAYTIYSGWQVEGGGRVKGAPAAPSVPTTPTTPVPAPLAITRAA
ncbi:LysE family translocator [Roseateles terrae]|uniref:Threonine/homoserine/homoserine lactone efflux protein n=1 Tax=Roseateles terrae TaxID=431060 RepID=A0ABR6GLQ2_9BURK|nr:LysE family translocator [Roseateles terrae]MBB3192985.1 threonine/homoserine/homoserine lactone efflux protein [Roseateles terrae]OWQ89770.1 hypothetical protein CDN98_04450 [Roseateles terrae]